jgi:hypothetical protein
MVLITLFLPSTHGKHWTRITQEINPHEEPLWQAV